MSRYALDHLSDHTLLHALATLVARDRTTTAELLAHIAEVDARKLHLPAAYPSLFLYCVHELHLSEDAAFVRIRAARTARQFPALFEAVADGRLHLSAVLLLTPYLTPETADELLAAASHKTKAQVEQLLAARFPRPDLLAWVGTLPASALPRSAPGRVEESVQLVPERVGQGRQPAPAILAPLPPGPGGNGSKVKPLGPQSFAVQFTLSQRAHDKLRYAQELLAHQVPSGDLAQVFERALDALIPQLERGRFAATAKPRPGGQRPSTHPHHIPAHVKRAVWARDGGQCTFVSAAGRRCPARTRLEFDHVLEVARGGEASVSGLRLRCRAHNQYAAECTFGPAFVRRKREEAQCRATETRARRAAPAAVPAPAEDPERDVAPWLRQLGFRPDEVRRGVELCAALPTDASLEARVRLAVSSLGRGGRRRAILAAGSSG